MMNAGQCHLPPRKWLANFWRTPQLRGASSPLGREKVILQNKAKKFPVLNDLRILHDSKSMFLGSKKRYSAVIVAVSKRCLRQYAHAFLWPRLDSEIKPGEEEA